MSGFPQGMNADQQDKLVTKSVYGGMQLVEQTGQNFFTDLSPDQFNSKFDIVAGAGQASETTASGPYTRKTLQSVGSKTVTQRVFKDVFSVSKTDARFDNYLNIQKMAMAIGRAYSYMKDDIKAEIFKNAFISTAPFGVTINGTANALFGNSQTVGATGLTQDNLETGDISEQVLDAMYDLITNLRNHDNSPLAMAPRFLLHSRFSRNSVARLVDSPNSPLDANNGINPFREDKLTRINWDKIALPTGTLLDTGNDTYAELKDNCFLLFDKPFLDLYALEAIMPAITVVPFDTANGGARSWYFDATLAAGAASTLLGVATSG